MAYSKMRARYLLFFAIIALLLAAFFAVKAKPAGNGQAAPLASSGAGSVGYAGNGFTIIDDSVSAETVFLDNGAWPMYCHDARHTCRSPYKGLTEQPVGPKWAYPSPGGIGGMTSSIAIGSDGKIYAGSAQNEEFIADKLRGYSGVLSAVFPDGRVAWVHDSHRGTPMISMIESGPLLTSDGKVIYGKDDGHVYALDKNGTLIWDFAADDPYDPDKADDNEQIINSPVMGNNTVYVLSVWDNVYAPAPLSAWTNSPVLKPVIDHYGIKGVKSQNWGKLYALDVQTGKRKWVFDPSFDSPSDKKAFWGSPAVGDNGTLYISAYDSSNKGHLYAINPDGTLKWGYPKGSDGTLQGFQSPPAIGDDGTIYAGSADSSSLIAGGRARLYAFNPDGTLKWSFEAAENRITSGPGIGPDGTLYFGSHNHPAIVNSTTRPPRGHMYALTDSGTKADLKWAFEVDYGITASPAIDSEGNVFFSTTSILPVAFGALGDYRLYALDKNGNELWSYPINGLSWGSPSIGSDGTVYLNVIQGEASLLAFGK